MTEIEEKGFIKPNIPYHSLFICDNCNKSVSIKYNYSKKRKWISFKCKCRTGVFYPSGHFSLIPKKVYLKNKEREEDEQET